MTPRDAIAFDGLYLHMLDLLDRLTDRSGLRTTTFDANGTCFQPKYAAAFNSHPATTFGCNSDFRQPIAKSRHSDFQFGDQARQQTVHRLRLRQPLRNHLVPVSSIAMPTCWLMTSHRLSRNQLPPVQANGSSINAFIRGLGSF